MLAKSERLSRTDFTTFFNRGKRVHSPLATAIISPHQQFHGAVVVSKKVSKKAVVRNALRRQVYGLLVTHLKQKEYQGVIIVILKPAILGLTKAARRAALREFIEQVRKSTYNSAHV